ncbi:10488_t:CDS:2 [Ambispora gerdemannii]|uniref:10488_t:CDS:1 n=1 Tax=Ambispora gerdemannii TaxID=144530 RepID=A0A9N9FH50_9GLOM|nr:10488_t:CDS:2 [Ambispora gerdemannii]
MARNPIALGQFELENPEIQHDKLIQTGMDTDLYIDIYVYHW